MQHTTTDTEIGIGGLKILKKHYQRCVTSLSMTNVSCRFTISSSTRVRWMMIARAIFVWTLLLSQAISENSKISFLREFSIEHGYFFQSGNTVDTYTMDSERSITRRISRNTKETVLVFSHNHYTLLDGSWHLTFH